MVKVVFHPDAARVDVGEPLGGAGDRDGRFARVEEDAFLVGAVRVGEDELICRSSASRGRGSATFHCLKGRREEEGILPGEFFC